MRSRKNSTDIGRLYWNLETCFASTKEELKAKGTSYKIRNPEKRSKLCGQYIRLKNEANLVVMLFLIILRKSNAKHIPQPPVEKPITLLINYLTPKKEMFDNGFPTIQLLEDAK